MTAASHRHARERRGRHAEMFAGWWLKLKGFRVLVRRWRTPVGEIDLVARRGELVVFVEVKSRRTLAAAAEAITPAQRRRVARAATHFLARHPDLADANHRFDALLLAPWAWPRHVAGAWADEGEPVSGRSRAPAARRPDPR